MPRSDDYPDHVQLLMLLWRTSDEPSPRSGLTVTRIVEAGIALADAEGLAAVTMRRVAEGLGVGAMSLYTYVPGKEELVALMVDDVHGLLPTGPIAGADWRARLATIARQRYSLCVDHPWLMDVPLTRPVVGPNVSDRYEHELAAIDGVGFTDLEMDTTLQLVEVHVRSTAGKAVAIVQDAQRSGMSDDEWWFSILPTLSRVMAGRDYPVAGRVGGTIGAPHTDPDWDFAFGLARILDGLSVLIASRTADDP